MVGYHTIKEFSYLWKGRAAPQPSLSLRRTLNFHNWEKVVPFIFRTQLFGMVKIERGKTFGFTLKSIGKTALIRQHLKCVHSSVTPPLDTCPATWLVPPGDTSLRPYFTLIGPLHFNITSHQPFTTACLEASGQGWKPNCPKFYANANETLSGPSALGAAEVKIEWTGMWWQ